MDSFDDEHYEGYISNGGSLSPSFYGECLTIDIDQIKEERRVPTMVPNIPIQQEEKKQQRKNKKNNS